MPPQAAAASQQGDFCRHGQLPHWHEDVGGEPLPFYVPLRKRLSVDGKSPAPRICIWECDGEAGDITCDIVAASFRRSCSVRMMQPPVPFFRMMTPQPPRPQRVLEEEEEEARKPGKTIRKGHRSYGLMLNLQLGISYWTALKLNLEPSSRYTALITVFIFSEVIKEAESRSNGKASS